MYIFAKRALCVIIIGIFLATLIFVLLFTGVLSLAMAEGFHVASLILAGLTLLLLLPLVLVLRQNNPLSLPVRYFGGLILVGAIGLLLNSFLTFFFFSVPVLLMVAIAVNTFLLTLLLGGNALLISSYFSGCNLDTVAK